MKPSAFPAENRGVTSTPPDPPPCPEPEDRVHELAEAQALCAPYRRRGRKARARKEADHG